MNLYVIFALLISALAGYLLGSINSSIIVSYLVARKDIRTMGSGNAGGTNVLRNLGMIPLLIVVLFDFAKTIFAVLFGVYLLSFFGIDPLIGAYIGGAFTILGNVFPVFFGFKGGKAVLTSAIVVLTIEPVVLLVLACIFILVAAISKMVSLSSITVAACFTIIILIISSFRGFYSIPLIMFSLFVAITIIWRHKSNIERIKQGTESKIGAKKQG